MMVLGTRVDGMLNNLIIILKIFHEHVNLYVFFTL
jgi:hypothetical protein